MAIANGKYKGNNLSLTIDSVEYNLDATSVVLDNEDADSSETTFADLQAGGSKQWFFTVTAVSDYGTGSLWNYVWSNSGDTDVAFVFDPYGDGPSTAHPQFTGTLTIPAKPRVGGDAGTTFTFDVRFDVDGEPTMVTA